MERLQINCHIQYMYNHQIYRGRGVLTAEITDGTFTKSLSNKTGGTLEHSHVDVPFRLISDGPEKQGGESGSFPYLHVPINQCVGYF